jgi:Translation initiation factor 2, beta subunit (eIF-2beta)/eIF-5 N-terminal domain
MNQDEFYDVDFLVDRFHIQYTEITGLSDSGKSKTIIKRPEIDIKNKKTFINNFTAICENMNRDVEVVADYIKNELQVKVSISKNGLVIHATYKKDAIFNVIKSYLTKYVQCSLCKSDNTVIKKIKRITYLICGNCHARNSVDV